MQIWQVTFARTGARVRVIKPSEVHTQELASLWDRSGKHARPTARLRPSLSRPTLRYARGCLRIAALGNTS
eukprot:2529559-Pyramimonas_sp.AAC.2